VRPTTCQDWGPIFLADNMNVTIVVAVETSSWSEIKNLYND
jgi:hypothetical protein